MRPLSFRVPLFAVLLTAFLLAMPGVAHAQTAFFSAPSRVNMAHDAKLKKP